MSNHDDINQKLAEGIFKDLSVIEAKANWKAVKRESNLELAGNAHCIQIRKPYILFISFLANHRWQKNLVGRI